MTKLPHIHETVKGWFNFDDIYTQAVAEAADGAIFVELGSYHGQSTAFMGVEIANSGKDIALFAVDLFQGNPVHGDPAGSIRASFDATIKRAGVEAVVTAMEVLTTDAAAKFDDGTVDFVFVDADHSYEGCRADIQAWLPKLKPGGVIAGHDLTEAWPGVQAAVQDQLPWSRVEVRRNSWWYRKPALAYRDSDARGKWTRITDAGFRRDEAFIFIPNVNTPDLLESALRSLGDYADEAVVIDSSATGHFTERNVDTFRPEGRWTFTQVQNWAIEQADRCGAEFLVFMHSDAELQGRLGDILDQLRNSPPNVAGLFTNYDALSAFRTDAIRKVGAWDETFPWYWADNDYYRRVRLAGFEIGQSSVPVIHHTSQTINRSTEERDRARDNWKWSEEHYKHKWGGGQGSETHLTPYGVGGGTRWLATSSTARPPAPAASPPSRAASCSASRLWAARSTIAR